MTVNEMHLAVQQGVDKINSLQADLLLPEEIDIELNKNMFKFINLKYGKNNKYGKGFEESQKRVDDLRFLLTEAVLLATFKEQLSNKFYIDTVELPNDYMYLINHISKVLINNCNPIAFTLASVDESLSYFTFDLDFALKGNTGFINSLVMRTDVDDLTTANYLNQTIWELPTGLQFPQDIEVFRLSLIDPDNIIAPGISIFWEQYGTLNLPGQFIVKVDTNTYPQFNWDASVTNTYTSTNLITSLVAVDTLNQIDTAVLDPITGLEENLVVEGLYEADIFDDSRIATQSTGSLKSQNKFVQQDDIFTLLNDPFNTTKHTKPLSTIRANNIDVYTNDIFITESVKILYIREPAQISLSLGTDCELPNHTHQEIVDMTVSGILEGISDPRYRSHNAEVGKNE